MSKKFIILVLTNVLIKFGFAQQTSWVERNGFLAVTGGKVVNSHNNAPQLRGVSLSWSIWKGRKYYNPDVINWLSQDFRINLLRVSMAVQPDSGYLQQPEEQEKLVITTVDAAIKNGLYVIIDWHDHHADQHLEQSKSFFARMAKKYAGKPNIIYEIFNEPEKIAWTTVKNYAVQVIAEIRKYDRENIIVVGSPKWDQDIDIAAKDPIRDYKNIAYSFHFYASEPSHQDLLMRKADEAIAAGLPVMVTEWGVGEADGNGEFDLEKVEKWFAWLERHKLSWVNWNITDKKETTAILQPGAPVTGNWKSTDLTPAGKFIRDKLRSSNH